MAVTASATALIWAAILATVFHPVYESLARLCRRPELAGALACLLITVAIIMPVIVLAAAPIAWWTGAPWS